ncbi:MAG: restriction endonuclease [Archangiaceae bacterium]|nr:restriction endonuclease [Archangiaceae bacterium]
MKQWKKYEKEVFERLSFDRTNADVRHNVMVLGRLSKAMRQIDVLVRERVAGRVVTTAVEAKSYRRRLNVKNVEEALGLFADAGVDRGVMVTTVGYSKAALERARADNVDIELDIVNLAELAPLQSDVCGIPYGGGHGALVKVPFGWVIDATRRGGAPAWLHRRGLSVEQAGKEGEFMYVQFWTKDRAARTLSALERLQRQTLQATSIRLERLKLSTGKRVLLRTAELPRQRTELTAFLDFADFIFFVVLHSPTVVLSRNRRKLMRLIDAARPLRVRFKPAA